MDVTPSQSACMFLSPTPRRGFSESEAVSLPDTPSGDDSWSNLAAQYKSQTDDTLRAGAQRPAADVLLPLSQLAQQPQQIDAVLAGAHRPACPTRRRLEKKQPPPVAYAIVEQGSTEVAAPWEMPDGKEALRKMLKQFYYQLEQWRKHITIVGVLAKADSKNYVDWCPLKDLGLPSRHKLVEEWIASKTKWSVLLTNVARAWAANTVFSISDAKLFFRGMQALFTYNGEWGVIKQLDFLDAVSRLLLIL